jgi:uncharacterized protein
MKLVDVNVLLYAVNKGSAHHRIVRSWWEDALNGNENIGLCGVVIIGFLRLATHPRILPKPLPVPDALDRIDEWLSQSNVLLVAEPSDLWPTLRTLLHESGTVGNLTTDAYLASLAIQLRATLVSTDSDFGRFRSLRWENPLI